jgi:hypothetical protein
MHREDRAESEGLSRWTYDTITEGHDVFHIVEVLEEKEYYEGRTEYLVDEPLAVDARQEVRVTKLFWAVSPIAVWPSLGRRGTAGFRQAGLSDGGPAVDGITAETGLARNPPGKQTPRICAGVARRGRAAARGAGRRPAESLGNGHGLN